MPGVRVHLSLPPILMLASLVLLAACGSDDDTTAPPVASEFILVHHAGDSLQVDLDDLPSFAVDDLQAVQLDDLVSEDLIPPYTSDEESHDARRLYAYQIEGEDGFSAHRDRGYPNNTWDQMALGYILTSTRRVIFPDDVIDLPGAYNVRDTRHVRIWRKFDVEIVSADTTVFYELAGLPIVQRPDADGVDEDAIDLAGFIHQLVDDERLDDPDAHVYHLTAIDGYGTADPLTWTQLQTGYWLLVSQRTRFSDPELSSGQYRLRMLERITVQ